MPNGLLSMRQRPIRSEQVRTLPVDHPPEARRNAGQERSRYIHRSTGACPHKVMERAKLTTSLPSTFLRRPIRTAATKCSRRGASASAHGAGFRTNQMPQLLSPIPNDATKVAMRKAVQIGITPIGRHMLAKAPSTPNIPDSMFPSTNLSLAIQIQRGRQPWVLPLFGAGLLA